MSHSRSVIKNLFIKLSVHIVAGIVLRACTTVNFSWDIEYLTLLRLIILTISKQICVYTSINLINSLEVTQCVYLVRNDHVKWAGISVRWVLCFLTVFAVASPDRVEMLLNGLLLYGELWEHQVVKRGTAAYTCCVFEHVINFV